MSAKSRPKAKNAKAKPKKAQAKKPAKAAPVAQKPKKQPKERRVKEQAPAPQKEAKQVKTERVNLGPPPVATVAARHIDRLQDRKGRGFSSGELDSAGVSLEVARRHGLSLDIRRRSVLEGNVAALSAWLKAPAPVKRQAAAE